nr:hypothetical protein CFP56_28677 [Quercus suber]
MRYDPISSRRSLRNPLTEDLPNMFSVSVLASLILIGSTLAASRNAIGSKGYYNITTSAFTLELDVANQVATRLIALAGDNAGSDPFNFLLPTNERTDDGYYFLGDLQLRLRKQNIATWTDLSSHNARKSVRITPGRYNVLTSADFTAFMGSNLPITVNRTWSKDEDSIVMTFNITNTGKDIIEMGGVGIPLPYNDNWIGKGQVDTWEQSVVSDPAISLDAGYVLTNRLTGRAPTLITAPVERSEYTKYHTEVMMKL